MKKIIVLTSILFFVSAGAAPLLAKGGHGGGHGGGRGGKGGHASGYRAGGYVRSGGIMAPFATGIAGVSGTNEVQELDPERRESEKPEGKDPGIAVWK